MVERGKVTGQEKMEGEVFELRSPVARNETINIEAVLDGPTKKYVVRVGSISGVAETLAEALYQLGNQIQAKHLYGSGKVRESHLPSKGVKSCQYCGGGIFFAKTPNDRWMPLDAKSVNANEIKGARCYVVNDIFGIPHVERLSRPQGQVWIAHPDVCGATDEAPRSAHLLVRWQENRKVAVERKSAAVQGLRDLVHDLGDKSD